MKNGGDGTYIGLLTHLSVSLRKTENKSDGMKRLPLSSSAYWLVLVPTV